MGVYRAMRKVVPNCFWQLTHMPVQHSWLDLWILTSSTRWLRIPLPVYAEFWMNPLDCNNKSKPLSVSRWDTLFLGPHGCNNLLTPSLASLSLSFNLEATSSAILPNSYKTGFCNSRRPAISFFSTHHTCHSELSLPVYFLNYQEVMQMISSTVLDLVW